MEYLTGLTAHVILDSDPEGNSDINTDSSTPHQSREGYRKVKDSVSEFDTDISGRFKEEEVLTYDRLKPNPEDWSK